MGQIYQFLYDSSEEQEELMKKIMILSDENEIEFMVFILPTTKKSEPTLLN